MLLLLPFFISPVSALQEWRSCGSLPDSPEREACYSIAHGNRSFVSTGPQGTILASPDSTVRFCRVARIPEIPFWSVSYCNGAFLTTGSNGFFISRDGIAWSETRLPTDEYLIAASWGNETYATVGTRGSIFSSPDGKTWTDRSLRANLDDFYGICFGNGRFVAVGIRGISAKSYIYTSSDAIHWTISLEHDELLWSIAFGGGLFISTGDHGAIVTSSNGLEWARRNSGTQAKLSSVAWGENRYVIVGDSGTVLESRDGCGWNLHHPGGNESIYSVTHGPDRFIAVGESGTIWAAPVDRSIRNSDNRRIDQVRHLMLNLGHQGFRIPLPPDFPGIAMKGSLFTAAGKLHSTFRIGDGGSDLPSPGGIACTPGFSIVMIEENGKKISFPVMVAR